MSGRGILQPIRLSTHELRDELSSPCPYLQLLANLVILGKAAPASLEHRPWSRRRLLLEDLQDHDGVWVDSVEDPPGHVSVTNAQFVAAWADRGHGAGLRHREKLTLL